MGSREKINTNILEVNGLTRKFNGLTAVDSVSFNVREGEIFGFLGPNGAGKTTTINMICTLITPTSGNAKLYGFDIVKDRRRVRNCIGLVFQDPSLDDKLTAMENLYFHSRLYNVPRETINKRCEQVLKMVDLYERRSDLVRNYSGGMKRRLEIARGLIHYPKLLFLDEPTIGLDPQTRNSIWDYIIQLKSKQKITIFLTTHYLEESEICDRIAIIDRGKIIALDTPSNLKKMAGHDIITVSSDNNRRLSDFLKDKLNVDIENDIKNEIKFEVKDSSSFIPDFIKDCPVKILSISARQSTLNDVFLNLTGKKLRDSDASKRDQFRSGMRMRGRLRR
jgi:ABC-2 type transport system ATP-binding protein